MRSTLIPKQRWRSTLLVTIVWLTFLGYLQYALLHSGFSIIISFACSIAVFLIVTPLGVLVIEWYHPQLGWAIVTAIGCGFVQMCVWVAHNGGPGWNGIAARLSCASICITVWAVTLFYWLMYPTRRIISAKDQRCSKCGYNLAGNVSGRCPECGEPIALS